LKQASINMVITNLA